MQSEKSLQALRAAQEIRNALMDRLDDEGETDLASRLERCGEKFRLTCSNCGHAKEVEKGCRQKWCPVCVRAIAAKRAARYALAVHMMEWPLFVTLTVPHDDSTPMHQLRRLRRSFGKLRRTRLWTSKTTGGVAGLEITSRNGTFHPHLHTVIDCKWLAAYTRPPQRGDSKTEIKRKCIAASDELGLAWARCLGIKSLDPDWCGVIFKIKRCDREGITTEVLKYSVKGTDLLETEQPVGPIIRALQATRLVTSFGSCFGRHRADDGATSQPRPCPCCQKQAWISDFEIQGAVRSSRKARSK